MVVASLAASHALGMGCSLVTSFDGVTGGAVDGGALAEGGSGGGDAASDASVDAAPTVDAAPDGRTKYTFVDSFERPNTAVGLANGWVAKTPSLRISDNRALRFNPGAGGDYRNNVTFRPSAESVRDVEVTAEVHFSTATPYPQVHARIQSGGALVPDSLDSYILFLQDNSGTFPVFMVARQRASDLFVPLAQFSGTEKLAASDVIRLKLRVEGAAPVTLTATVEIQGLGGFVPFAAGAALDADAARIEAPGVVGLSAGGEANGVFAYDNFAATEL